MQHLYLYLFRQGRGETLQIHFLTVCAYRLHKQLMPGLVGKILLYVVLALAVLIGGPFALGFWLGGVRAKYRIKNEKLKMKN